ncbi:hypothetical protein GCM10027169_40160 [Gordonia jinhuaensis]|uniref:Uncharacterized protein n=2 Tax=Gordonia jinhuaensis TaxID=1517702 RepID=A0A916WSE5_9ACTN|nr:hypothetical protein GCM10011489_11790 [Gordonia jinhuaensis]
MRLAAPVTEVADEGTPVQTTNRDRTHRHVITGVRRRRQMPRWSLRAALVAVLGIAAVAGSVTAPAGADVYLNYRLTGFRSATAGTSWSYLGMYTGDGVGAFSTTIVTGTKVAKDGSLPIVGGHLQTTTPYPLDRSIVSGSVVTLKAPRGCVDLRRVITYTYRSSTPLYTTVQFVETEMRRPVFTACVTIGITLEGALNHP